MVGTAADYLAEALHRAGVNRVYGVVGDSLNGFTDSLRRLDTIEWVHMRHEEAAAFAAGAEGHLTGKLVVCADPDGTTIHPQYLNRLVSELAAEDAIFTCDVGTPASSASAASS